jgi:AAT family amino acid transporter/GABA permease
MHSSNSNLDIGDAPELSRALLPRHVTMITIGGIIGAGLFVGSSVALATTGPVVIVSYALTGLLFMLVMRCLGEMAVARPEIRSFTDFPRAVLGPCAGFVVGWLYWYFWIIVIPVEAIAGAVIVHQWLPQVPTIYVGVTLVIAMTAVNLMSTRSYGEFEFWFASIKVVAITIFILGCLAYVMGLFGDRIGTVAMWNQNEGPVPRGSMMIVSAIPTIFFSMTGAEISAIAAAESPDPAKAVAKMVSAVVWRILIFYLASLGLIVCIVPWHDIKPGVSPFVQTLESIHVAHASTIMAAIILTAVLSCLNSSFYVVSRVLFVLASHGDAPRRLVKLNARKVPVTSVLIGTVAGLLGIVAQEFAPSLVFAFLVNASGALIVFIYLITCVSQVLSRRELERLGRPVPEPRMWLFPWLSYAAIAAMSLVLVAMAFSKEMASQLWASVVSIVIAFICYGFRRRWAMR